MAYEQNNNIFFVSNRLSNGRISVTDIDVNDGRKERPASGVSIFSTTSVCHFLNYFNDYNIGTNFKATDETLTPKDKAALKTISKRYKIAYGVIAGAIVVAVITGIAAAVIVTQISMSVKCL
jgi:hypothetical protein